MSDHPKKPARHGRSTGIDRNAIAVLHRTDGAVQLVIADAGQAPLQIRDTRTVPASDAETIAQVLHTHRVGRVFVTVPSGDVICRNCTLPDADPEQLGMALRLQAEAALLGVAPDHRVAQAVLDAAPGETSRNGLVLAWPENATVPQIPLPDDEHMVVTYAPDVAGLAALLDGLRPNEPLVWIDRSTESVAAAITHSGGAVFRCVREDAETNDEWAGAVTRALAESAINVGHSGSYVDSMIDGLRTRLSSIDKGDTALLASSVVFEHVGQRCTGTQDDPAWWNDFGIAIGVAIAATSSLADLCLLEADHAEEEAGRVEATITALSKPRTAIRTVIACLGIVAVLPLVFSGARLGLLKLRHGDVDQQVADVALVRDSVRMYEALDDAVWPMAKIVSDIVCNTPEGIELGSIRLNQADGSFAVSGTAIPHDGRTATEVIKLMHEQLGKDRVFSDIGYNWDPPNAYGHYEFDLTARVRQPHRAIKYDEARDFGRVTLQARLWPDLVAAAESADADATVTSIAADDPAPTETPPSNAVANADDDPGDDGSSAGTPARTRPLRPSFGGTGQASGGNRGDVADRSNDSGAQFAMPEPLTQAQIDAMSIDEVRQQLSSVSEARKRIRGTDHPDADRLKSEFEMLMARLREGI